MTIENLFEWWQFISLAILNLLGIIRGVVLRTQGVRVLSIDKNQPISQHLRDLILVVILVIWFYESIIASFSIPFQLLPSQMYIVLVDQIWLQAIGAVLMLVGLLVYAIAIRSFRSSWRIGIDGLTPGALVTDGIFAWTRNPIYLSLDCCVIGTFLIHGRLIFLGIAVSVLCLLHDQIRREESFLGRTYGQEYYNYCNRTNRYLNLSH